MKFIGVPIALILLWVLLFVMIGACQSRSKIWMREGVDLPVAQSAIDVVTWNIGYAGLGAKSDFVADGGTHIFPPSRKNVRENLSSIKNQLSDQKADIILLQEVARPSPLNWWVNILASTDKARPLNKRAFYPDIHTRFSPPPLRFSHGLAVYSKRQIDANEIIALPLEKGHIFPGVKRHYALLVSRLPIQDCKKQWVIVNVHLAAFDENGTTRNEQLKAVIEFAKTEYESGNFVIIGGDWNLQLYETQFPTTTKDEFLFWIHPYPYDILPEGWSMQYDKTKPTVRTNERPYKNGENYRTIIDGFLTSPNVNLKKISGIDLDFQYADHNPVSANFEAVSCATTSASAIKP